LKEKLSILTKKKERILTRGNWTDLGKSPQIEEDIEQLKEKT
jgi:hypothetical protein